MLQQFCLSKTLLDICFKSLKILLQQKFYNKNFNKHKPLQKSKPFILTQIFTKIKHTQQIEAMIGGKKVQKKQRIERDDHKDEDDIISFPVYHMR